MARLRTEIKRFITMELACFDTPTEVAASVKETFGVEVNRQQVQAYDPTTYAGRSLSRKLKELFEATREQFESEALKVPIASRVYRLRRIDRIYHRAVAMGNHVLAAEMLKQAAQDAGGAFTNRREHSGEIVTITPEQAASLSDAALKRYRSGEPLEVILRDPTSWREGEAPVN